MTDLSTIEARELAGLGIRVFPCRPLDKRPAVNAWPDVAAVVFDDDWFDGRNVAVRCGATNVEGLSFFVVDVDIKNGQPGAESWAQFCDEHPEVREAAESTVMSYTPSGGWHFWFVVPEGFRCPSNGRPWPGVDIRGEGGYVLAPPSRLPNGEYTWVRDPWDNVVLEAPPALVEALLSGDGRGGTGDTATQHRVVDRSPRGASLPDSPRSENTADAGSSPSASTRSHTSGLCPSCAAPLSGDGSCATPSCTRHGKRGSIGLDGFSANGTSSTVSQKHLTPDDNPIDHACKHFDVMDWLLRGGWQPNGGRGDEVQMTRPGKPKREGTSATMHRDENIVNVYTTTVDPMFETVGKRSPSGCYTINGWDAWMIENGYTNVSEAMRDYRFNVLGVREPGPDIMSLVPSSGPSSTPMSEDPVGRPSSKNLPDEFWESRPVLTHIRDAAWSTSTSPDAVLAAVLTRYSANLHPSIMLPNWGTLDLFVVIEGHSGSGKSKASKTARMLYPGGQQREVMMDRQVGSGEGLAEAFFEWRDEDGNPCSSTKKGARKVMTRWGLHFSTDEAVALTASAGRMGSILIPTMCAAWMGESIGQLLADPTKSRMIEPHKVRVSAELKIQTMHGWKLFQEEYAATGLSQRMICFTATDPQVYDRFKAGIALPPWPGQLDLPTPFILTDGQPRVMGVSPGIAAFLAESAAETHNPKWAGDPLDTHANLSRLKVAAILALWDDRFDVDDQDFDLARVILDAHRNIRSILQSTKARAESDRRHTAAQLRAEAEIVVDDAKRKALLRDAITFLTERIEAGKPLGKKHMSQAKREVYEEAMTILEAQGLVEELPTGGWSARGG